MIKQSCCRVDLWYYSSAWQSLHWNYFVEWGMNVLPSVVVFAYLSCLYSYCRMQQHSDNAILISSQKNHTVHVLPRHSKALKKTAGKHIFRQTNNCGNFLIFRVQDLSLFFFIFKKILMEPYLPEWNISSTTKSESLCPWLESNNFVSFSITNLEFVPIQAEQLCPIHTFGDKLRRILVHVHCD